MKIAAIDITRHRIALDPPVPVSWDSRPRGSFTITLVRVRTDEGLEGAPYLEFPFDPPDWVPARRDFYLEETIETDDEGWLVLPDRPGLGVLPSTKTSCARPGSARPGAWRTPRCPPRRDDTSARARHDPRPSPRPPRSRR